MTTATAPTFASRRGSSVATSTRSFFCVLDQQAKAKASRNFMDVCNDVKAFGHEVATLGCMLRDTRTMSAG